MEDFDSSSTVWAWNRAFFAGCSVRPSARTAAGDADVHNSPLLHPGDYLPALAAPAAAARAVFVGTCALPAFVRDVLPRVACPIVLVTGMSDPGPAAVLGSAAAAHALAGHPLLRAWFAEMRDWPACALPARCAACARTHALPIGVDLHTLAFRPGDRPSWGPAAPPRAQAAAFAAAAVAAGAADAAGVPRAPTVYVHFGWRPPPRREALKLLRANPRFFVEPQRHMERGELWARMARHRWVLCLQGGGPDCHRTWEALGLGCGVVCEALPHLVELLGGNATAGGDTGVPPPPPPPPRQGAGAAPLAFVCGLPVAAVFAPPVNALLSRDPAERMAAREGWREGALSVERLEAEWRRVEEARAAARAAAAADSPKGAPPVVLPALLAAEFWLQKVREAE
jgi:hypothetical protein